MREPPHPFPCSSSLSLGEARDVVEGCQESTLNFAVMDMLRLRGSSWAKCFSSKNKREREKRGGKFLLKAGKRGQVAGRRDQECMVVGCVEEKGVLLGLQQFYPSLSPPLVLRNPSG